jgi:hypothetical protein
VSAETWIWKAVAYAASQLRTTWTTVAGAPRSTCIHCGSLNWLDHRVPELPSTAADAGVPAFSTDEAVAGLFWDSSVVAAAAGNLEAAAAVPATRIATTATATAVLRRRPAGRARNRDRARSIGTP